MISRKFMRVLSIVIKVERLEYFLMLAELRQWFDFSLLVAGIDCIADKLVLTEKNNI